MISSVSRKKILDIIFSVEESFKFANSNEGIIPFLNEIWNLESMPSEDNRFKNAEQDIIQHTINNDDWSWSDLFKVRLKLIESEDKFETFIKVFLLPKYQNSPESTIYFRDKINDIIESDKVTLSIIGYENNFPVLELDKIHSNDWPNDIPINRIPFYVRQYERISVNTTFNDLEIDPTRPKQHFVLIPDDWDDYSYETIFLLVYINNIQKRKIGLVKIGRDNALKTREILPTEFLYLEKGFVSLGQSNNYYTALSDLFGKMLPSILYSLKDAAFFSEVSEDFENLDVFKQSLIRTDEAERVHRIIKPMIQGADLEDLYSFEFSFCPKYADTAVPIPFQFTANGPIPKRMTAIIGKNGAGKTQLLTTLPLEIAKKNSELLIPRKPIYSKIIAVSYSTFDNFELPKKTSDFNYVYCGLRDEQGNIRSKQGQLQKFHNTWKKIEKLGRLKKWKRIISNFIEVDLIDFFIKVSPEDSAKLYFDQLGFKEARESLSSGQSIVLFVVSEIVANIRLDSLLLFDEPETHLHPNAISQLMNGIAQLIDEFDSFCIIATHSPIIIQEMFSRDVLIISREENVPSVKNIGVESFGENLSVITEEIFGNRTIPKHYENILTRLVIKHKNYDDVLKVLREGNLPMSLNVRLYLQSMVNKHAEN